MLVHLVMLVLELVLVVEISGRVVQRYMDCLEMNACGCLRVLGSCRCCWVFLVRCR